MIKSGKLYLSLAFLTAVTTLPMAGSPAASRVAPADGTGLTEQPPSAAVRNGAAITTTPELVFAGSIDGFIRAHHTATGAVLWSFNTARDFVTPSGMVAAGGAMEGAASAVLHDEMMFLNSGYLFNPNMPGNLFLAFTIDDEPDK